MPKERYLDANLQWYIFQCVANMPRKRYLDAHLQCYIFQCVANMPKKRYLDAHLHCYIFQCVANMPKKRYLYAHLQCYIFQYLNLQQVDHSTSIEQTLLETLFSCSMRGTQLTSWNNRCSTSSVVTYVIGVNLTKFVSSSFLLEKIRLLECEPRCLESEASLTVPSELNGQNRFWIWEIQAQMNIGSFTNYAREHRTCGT